MMSRLSQRSPRIAIRAIAVASIVAMGVSASWGGPPQIARAAQADAIASPREQPPLSPMGGDTTAPSPTPSLAATATSAVLGHDALVSGSTGGGDALQVSLGSPVSPIAVSGQADMSGHFALLVPIDPQMTLGPSSIYLTDKTTGISATLSTTIAATGWTFDAGPPLQATAPAVALGLDGRLYSLGGTGSGATGNQIYTPSTGAWTAGAGLPINVCLLRWKWEELTRFNVAPRRL